MSWRNLLVSPPPATGWSLDTALAAVVRRESKDRIACAMVPVPEEAFSVGPVGLQMVRREALDPVLAGLQQSARGSKRPIVVIPSSWVRSHLLEFDQLPRRREEMDDIVRWRLKKLLPVPPQQLRLALVNRVADGGKRRLLCMVGLDKALTDLEESLAEVGVQPGCLTSRIFAMALGSGPGSRAVIQQESRFLSTVVLEDDQPILLRTKPLPEPTGPWDVIAREQHLVLSYLRERLGLEARMRVTVLAEAPEIDHGLRTWWAESEGIDVEPPVELPSCAEAMVADQLGRSRLEPLCAALGGRA